MDELKEFHDDIENPDGMAAFNFNDDHHVKAHIRYLFRTDGDQKWTNDLTQNDIFFLDGEMWKFPQEFEDRKKIEKVILEKIKNVNYEDLMMVRLNYFHDDVWHINDDFMRLAIDLLNDIENENNIKLICAVIHEDQEDTFIHLHLLLQETGK